MVEEDTLGGGEAPRVIQVLRREHENLVHLLDLLEREIDTFECTGKPDYEIVEAILAYCLGYPDACHHPKEDTVLARLRAQDPDAGTTVRDLEGEHRDLAALTRQLADSVERVLMEVEMPRGWFTEAGRRYMASYRRHMEKEEKTFFPAAIRALALRDWADIAERTIDTRDSLYGAKTEKQLEALRKDIKSSASDRAGG